jgi:hypothetical protein
MTSTLTIPPAIRPLLREGLYARLGDLGTEHSSFALAGDRKHEALRTFGTASWTLGLRFATRRASRPRKPACPIGADSSSTASLWVQSASSRSWLRSTATPSAKGADPSSN